MRLPLRPTVLLALSSCVLTGSFASAFAFPAEATLRWTAPGDDGVIGRAVGYDIRYSLTPITPTNFLGAIAAQGVPTPKPAGSPESFSITNLADGHGYYFAIRTTDDAANWSQVSNVTFYSVRTVSAPGAASNLWLSPPWPNPTRDHARWTYTLPHAGPVVFDAFDLAGRHVRDIARGWRDAGEGGIAWDLRDDDGRSVAAGVYLVCASLGGQTWVKRLIVTR